MDADEKIKISVRNLDFFYAGGHQALFGNSIDPQRGKPTNIECIARLAEAVCEA